MMSIRSSRWVRSGVAACALVALLANCGGSTAGPSSASPSSARPSAAAPSATSRPTDSGPTAANPVTVNMAVVSNILYAPIYVGVEKGIYLKHGINLKINLVTSGNESVKALQAGQAQFIGTTFPATVPAVVQGVPLKVFGLVSGRPDVVNYDAHLAIVVGPGITATRVADLKGLRIASSFGGGSDAYLHVQLRTNGVADADAKFINVTPANFLSSLQTKSVDAVGGTEPYISQILAALPGSSIVVRGGGVSEARIVMAALGSWLEQNAPVADRLVEAQAEAEQYARQHFDDLVVATSHYLSDLDPKVLAASLKPIDFDPRWSSKVQEGFDGASQVLVANGSVKQAPKTVDLLALELLTSPEKKFPQFFSDLKK